jgi:hypothetical protein
MTDTPQILLAHHLKALKLPTFIDILRSRSGHPGAERSRHLALERHVRRAGFVELAALPCADAIQESLLRRFEIG